MEEVISRFLTYLFKERAAAINTINAYGSDLKQFAQFLQNYPQKTSLKTIILEYLSSLREKKYSQASCARKFATLRSFFHWLETKGILKINPTEGIAFPNRLTFKTQVLQKSEIKAFLEVLMRSSVKKATRDLAIFTLLYATGIKSTELVSLDIDKVHVTPRNPYIEVGVNEKSRLILLPRETAEVLKRYINKVRRDLLRGRKERALFLSQKGGRLTRQGVWLILRKHTRKAGIESNITAGIIRHSFVKHQLVSGVLLAELQLQLGYTNIESTSRYRRMLQETKAH